MPEIGDIQRASDIGYKGHHKYEFVLCPACEKGRWVRINEGGYFCRKCSREGDRSPNWKGGRQVEAKGYIKVPVSPEDIFYSMADGHHRVFEHRLIMARHLGRPLLRSEQVHHLGTKYPQGSYEDKGDNRIENLELMPNPASHTKKGMCGRCQVTKEIRLLRWQIKEQANQIKELTVKLMRI